MTAVHTRKKESKFHENRREDQKVRTFKGGFFQVRVGAVEDELCEVCNLPVVGGGIKINNLLYHNACFNSMRKL